jgi:hypothetical protein
MPRPERFGLCGTARQGQHTESDLRCFLIWCTETGWTR